MIVLVTLFSIIVLSSQITASASGQQDVGLTIRSDPFDPVLALRIPETNTPRDKKRLVFKQTNRDQILERNRMHEQLRKWSKTEGALQARTSGNVYPDANPMPLTRRSYAYYPDTYCFGSFLTLENGNNYIDNYDAVSCMRMCNDYQARSGGSEEAKEADCKAAIMEGGSTCLLMGNSAPGTCGASSGSQVYLAGNCDFWAQSPDLPATLKPTCEEVRVGNDPAANDYQFTGQLQTFVAPYLGSYTFTLYGGSGGLTPFYITSSAGPGAGITVSYYLQKGATVSMVIGEQGKTGSGDGGSGGGGGGSFAYLDSFLILAAGGGGGAATTDGYPAAAGREAFNGDLFGGQGGDDTGIGGIGGSGDDFAYGRGGGGAGWNSAGTPGDLGGSTESLGGGGGECRPSWTGGKGENAGDYNSGRGGYGGGGGGGVQGDPTKTSPGGGGGGGGWSGGGGGGGNSDGGGGGGGGSSYAFDGNVFAFSVTNVGHGYGSVGYTL